MVRKKSWGGGLLSIALLLAPLCSGAGDVAVSFSKAPRRVSKSASAVFAFRAQLSGGGPCGDCTVTCQLDGGRASDCGGTETVRYAGLKDGKHTLAVCAGRRRRRGGSPTCATYAWDVDTVPPTASVTAGPAFTSASNVSALISFSEPCLGFACNDYTHCDLIVYGPGRVEPSTLQVLRPALRYSVAVTISPDAQYGRLILAMARGRRGGLCTDAAGHRFTRTSNSTFALHFDRRSDSMSITSSIPEKLLQIQGATRVVQATNDAKDLRIYLSFAQPVLNSSAQILSVLEATDAVLTPTNRSTLGHRRFGFLVNKISDTAVVTVACDTSSIVSRQGTPVFSAAEPPPFTFLYDTQRPRVKLGTSTWRTSSHNIPVLIKFAEPVFNFSSSGVQVSGGNVLRFHEASKSIYTVQIQAVDKLVSVQVAENAAQDVAGNPNLASDRLQVRHYSVPASSSWIASLTSVVFGVTAVAAALLAVSTSSLLASGAISRPSPHMISEPSRNLLRMACHIQIFALSRWLSVSLPVEYYEFAKGIEWSIPYMQLPWEGPAADPFLGYSTMPATATATAVAYSEPELPMVDTAAAGAGNGISYPGAQPPLDGKPLTAMEYRSFFENPDMKPEAQIITKLQDLDGWKYFGRNMLWLGVIGGGLILVHALTLLYLKLRYGRGHGGYGALVFPRLEVMLAILAMPCVSQAAAALIRGGTTGGLALGIALTGVLTSFLLGLLLFLSLGITLGRLLQYREVHQEAGRDYRWYQDLLIRRTLGPGKRGQWTWKDPRRSACLARLGPLFEDLRGPPKYMLTQIAAAGPKGAGGERIMASEDENEDAEAPLIQKLFGVLRIYFTFLESVKRVAVGIVAGAHASSDRSSRAHAVVLLSMASFQLLFMLLKKPFIRKRVQLVEMLSVAGEVFVFAACLALIDRADGEGRGLGLAMLGAFVLGLAAQACNEWNALYRQVRFLSADRSSFLEGAKAACSGLLLLVLPSSVVTRNRQQQEQEQQQQQAPEAVGERPRGEERASNERWWLRQLREMAKASFSKDGGEQQQEASSSGAKKGGGDCKSSSKDKSRGLYSDLEAIFSSSTTPGDR